MTNTQLHLDNINSFIQTMPESFIYELSYSLENYKAFTSEQPMSVCAKLINRVEFKEMLSTQQMTTLTLGIIPEVKLLTK